MTATLPGATPPPSITDDPDELLHTVCETCRAAYCDGGECDGLTDEVQPSDLLCTVCEDLATTSAACPHCGSPP